MKRFLVAVCFIAVITPRLCAVPVPPRYKPLPPPDNNVSVLMANPPGEYPAKPHPRGYVAYRTTSELSIDGRLDEEDWDAAPWTEEFVDIIGDKGLAPWHPTRAKLLWDHSCLYIGAYLTEPQPWATLKLHDSVIFQDNDFEVFIDPDGDNWFYFENEFNAYGSEWDLFLIRPYRNGGPPLMSWEEVRSSEATQAEGPSGWRPLRRATWVNGSLNDGTAPSDGWSIEIAIPWSLFSQAVYEECPPKPGSHWRINFSRVEWNVTWDDVRQQYVKTPKEGPENNWVWSPQWIVNMHYPEYWGYLQFEDVNVQEARATPVPFRSDPSWPLRTFLMNVYYAQTTYYSEHGRYTVSWGQLGVQPPPASLAQSPKIQITDVTFVASADLQLGGTTWRYYINEQSQLTKKDVSELMQHS